RFIISFFNKLLDHFRLKVKWSCLFLGLALLRPAHALNNQTTQSAAFSFLLHTHGHTRCALTTISKGNKPAPSAWQRLRTKSRFIFRLIILAILKNSRHSICNIERATQHRSTEWQPAFEATMATFFTAACDVLIC